MAKRNALAAMGVAVALTGLSAQSAMAGTIAKDRDAQTGVVRLLFGESRVSANDPLDPTKTVPVSEVNTITITSVGGGNIRVHDNTTALAPRTLTGSGCTVVDSNTVDCNGTDVTQLVFPLGLNNDSFDNRTTITSVVMGGDGTDTIVNAGGGDDAIDVSGNLADTVQSCGDGVDHLVSDKKDTLPTDDSCEFINGVDQRVPTAPPPPPVDTGGGSSGAKPPVAPPTQAPIVAAAPDTAVPAPPVAPTTKAGACQVKYLGTAGDDRIDGSGDGDIEYGLAGADYMTGQLGDDCLYGGLGADTLIGAEGIDLLVGEAGNDKVYGGDGNDKLFGNAGDDRLYGNAGTDRLSAGLGNDRASGDAGNDTVLGGDGNDSLAGGSGNDTVSGGAGRDTISGGPGSDSISGGPGRDIVRGDAGNDKINVRDGQRDVVNCGLGRDSVTADKVDVLRNCESVTRR